MLLGSVSVLGINGGMLRICDTQVAENILPGQAKSPHGRANPNVVGLGLRRRLPLFSPLIIQAGHERVDVIDLATAIIVAPVGRRRVKLDGGFLGEVHVLRLFFSGVGVMIGGFVVFIAAVRVFISFIYFFSYVV